MKPALIAAIVLALAVYLAPRSQAKQRPTQEAPGSYQENPHTVTAIISFAMPDPQEWPEAHNESAQNKPPSGDKTVQWILIAITAITAAVIGWQAYETRRAAQAARSGVGAAQEAADAAKLNAQAVINAERPWITTSLVPEVKWIDTGRQDRMGQIIKRRVVYFNFALHNIGKTPAEIISVISRHDETKRGGELSTPPDYGLPSQFEQQRILAQGDSWEYDAWSIEQVLVDTHQRVTGEGGDFDLWHWRYGHIVYRNLVDRSPHETRFCYMYIPGLEKFVISGPAEYTKYT